MNARSINGSASSWNTLNLSFEDDTGLTPASTVVPLPAAVWLLGSALVGLLAYSARGRHPD